MQINKTNIARIIFAIFVFFLAIWLYGLSKFVEKIALEPNKNPKKTDAIILIKSNDLKLESALEVLQADKSDNLIISGITKETNLPMLLSDSFALTRQTYKYLMKMKIIHCCEDLNKEVEKQVSFIKEKGYKSISLVAYNHDISKLSLALKRRLSNVEIDLIPVIDDQFTLKKWWRDPQMKRVIFKSYNTYLVNKYRFKLI